MAHFTSAHPTFPEMHLHFDDQDRASPCDHCLYFKGIVHRCAVRQNLTGEDEQVTRRNNLMQGPRSLESIALAEEAIEQREHARFMSWSRSRAAITNVPPPKYPRNKAKGVNHFAGESDTAEKWLNNSTKEELIAWLEKRNNPQDNMDELRRAGIFDLREHILHRNTAQPTRKPSTAYPIAAPVRAEHNDTATASPQDKKSSSQKNVFDQRIQAHKSLKPPQAALRQREELRRWYAQSKAPELRDELRQRGIKPMHKIKVDLIEMLVEDDKKEV
ncbi:hypothetical protein C7974DRAFT_66085 [Boeremia exigua]|uniref:uncharacterized protein n=1 Tax=Boeremia exigua TaxID=749465 RepID=UPI001E8CE0F2|nr:uncharacterized protein C7974DRAFT_66085 [Boeremia exigua]KAH6613871.1 hypothetical protein C7974DRAFT_66085 [Boeremia exigua]